MRRLAAGSATADQIQVARAHLKHCSACRPVFAQLREQARSAEFGRSLAELFPYLPVAEVSARSAGGRGPLEALSDWLARPFANDAAVHAASLSGGSGRGIGTLAVALCLGGTAVGGTYCAVTGDVPLIGEPASGSKTTKRQPAPRSTPSATPTVVAADLEAAMQAATDRRARERAAARRTAQRRARRRSAVRAQRRARTAAAQERQQTISPAPATAAPDGSSEFDPTFDAPPPQPAAPAPSNGLPEFP